METRSLSSTSRNKLQTNYGLENSSLSQLSLIEESDSSASSTDSSFSGEEASDSSNDEVSMDSEDFFSPQSNEEYKFDWKEASRFTVSKKIPEFQSNCGLKEDLSHLKEPAQFYDLILPPQFLEKICQWSNDFAEKERRKRRRDSHEKKWESLTPDKLKAYFGFILLCSLVHKPRMTSYWSKKRLTETPGMQEIFSRDEFYLMKRYIRFYSGVVQENDTFYRIRPLIEEIIYNTNKFYSPPKELTLDESMINFNGRAKFKVYMPLKPIKFGFKVYTVASGTEPIVLNLSIYNGESKPIDVIVSQLLLPYEGEGHVVYMDRFYTSPLVFRTLENMGFGACGTCMVNRLHLNEDMKYKIDSLGPKEYCYFKDGTVLLSVWRDSKIVYMLSTVHHVTQRTIERRKRKKDLLTENNPNKLTEKVKVPECIDDYNNYSKGVDLVDQYISYFTFGHRSHRWYFCIIIFLLEVAAINSYVLYQRSNKANSFNNYHDFRRQLSKGLIQKWKMKRKIPSTPAKKIQIFATDIPIELLGRCYLASGTSRNCNICKKRRSTYECGACNVSLCVKICYDLHRIHTEKKIRIIE